MDKFAPVDPVENFIEQMGNITRTDGGPRIAGRILGLLIVEGQPFALHEMAERLKISKASASTNARMLADRGMIRLVTRAGDRQDYYELVPRPYKRMLETIGVKMEKTAAKIDETELLFEGKNPAASERVRELAAFYRQSAEFMADWAKRLTL